MPAEGEDVKMRDLSPRGFLDLEEGEQEEREEVEVHEEERQEEEDPMEVISIGSEEEGVKESEDALFDTEDDIVAKDISISSGIEAAPFDVSVYKQTRVLVSLDSIVVPPNTARDLDQSHAAKIGRDLVK